jgi:hypothetical protein
LTYKKQKKIQQSYLSSIEIDQKLIRFFRMMTLLQTSSLIDAHILYTPQPKVEVNRFEGKRSGLKGSARFWCAPKRQVALTRFYRFRGQTKRHEWKSYIKTSFKDVFTKIRF